MPRPTDSEPCGSKSTSSTLRPSSASAAPRLIVVVVLPTPPFWLHIAMMRALPWIEMTRGSGSAGQGRPVGPGSPTAGMSSVRKPAWTASVSGWGARGAGGASTAASDRRLHRASGTASRCRNGSGADGARCRGGAGGRISGGISVALEP